MAAKMADKMYLSYIFAYISPRMLFEVSKYMFLKVKESKYMHPMQLLTIIDIPTSAP